MRTRRLVFYLFLNALVSACVTGGILYFYDRHQRSTCASSPSLAGGSTPVSSPETQMDILAILGAGTLEAEVVVIQNNGSQAVDLEGWVLRDSGDAVYTFPAVTVYPQGTVQVHTSRGTNTPVDLYWARTSAVWETGEIASLFDAQGVLRAVYTIP